MDESERFELDVKELLRLHGWSVAAERLLGHKKVDCYAEKSAEFGQKYRIAVECKTYSSRLTREQVSAIYADYLPLVQQGQIDFILLVTKTGVAASAATYVDEADGFRHRTYIDLMNDLLDFSAYARGLQAEFSSAGVSSYYIQQKCDQAELPAESFLLDWIDSDDDQPVAVLGGYGMGKSTLARRVASLLAERHIMDPNSRVPILIQLEDVSTDQSLEGLLGRQFTSLSIVPNYNFGLFMALNSNGRFVIFLDGFDEMKRTMSWDSLLYNLKQLNRLVAPNSKVVLLGRPTAFLTDEEHNEALHGRSRARTSRLDDWPDYREVYLRPFSRDEVMEYIKLYLAHFQREGLRARGTRRIERYLTDLDDSKAKPLVDLASRPVQLKMLMDVLPDYKDPIDDLTVTILYSEFIDLLIRREMQKLSRQSFSHQQRRRFVSSLAAWMWRDRAVEVESFSIPDELFDEYVVAKADREATKRDLMNGSILEKKPPHGFYFAHRSFQEFLVAEQLSESVASSKRMVDCPYLTTEIINFFLELIGKREVLKWRRRGAGNSNATELLEIACRRFDVRLPGEETRTVHFSKPARQRKPRRLLIQEVVGDNEGSNEPAAPGRDKPKPKSRKQRSGHRLSGVTPKGKYRSGPKRRRKN